MPVNIYCKHCSIFTSCGGNRNTLPLYVLLQNDGLLILDRLHSLCQGFVGLLPNSRHPAACQRHTIVGEMAGFHTYVPPIHKGVNGFRHVCLCIQVMYLYALLFAV